MPNSCARPNATVLDQESAETGTTDSETLVADAVDGDCDSEASPEIHHMQRGNEDSANGLGGVAAFIEGNPDNVPSTLEWSANVQYSQRAIQATTSTPGQQQTAEHWRGSLKVEIELILRQYHEQETVVETEIVKLEQGYQLDVERLERVENAEEDHPAAGWWDVGSDYQPTECGSDGGQ